MNSNIMGSSESKDSSSKANGAQYSNQVNNNGSYAAAGGDNQSQSSGMGGVYAHHGQAMNQPMTNPSMMSGGDNHSQYSQGSQQYTGSSYYSLGSTGGWIAETDQRIFLSGLVPPGYSTAPNVPEGVITKGCEPCVNVPKNPTGMKLFQAMRKEWRTKTVNPPPPQTIDDVDPDDIADAIEETPGDILEPSVHLPVMLDILIDIWEDSGLYD